MPYYPRCTQFKSSIDGSYSKKSKSPLKKSSLPLANNKNKHKNNFKANRKKIIKLLNEKRLRLQLSCAFHDFTQDGKHICYCEDRTIHKIENQNCKPENANKCRKPEKCMFRKSNDTHNILYSTTID